MRPADRLSAAFRIEVSPTTRNRHLALISETLRAAPTPRSSPTLGLRRRLVAAAAAMAAVFVPVGAAVAAEAALPGEFLYPVKQFTEDVRSVFDEDLSATHRVEELEALLDGTADPAIVVETERRATEAVAELDDPAELAERLERARVRMRRQVRQGGGAGPEESGGTTEAEEPGSTPGAGTGEQHRQRDRDDAGAGTPPPTSEAPEIGDTEPSGTIGGSGVPGTSGSGAGGDGAGGDGPGGNGPGGDGNGGSETGGQGTGGSGTGSGGGSTGGQDGSSGNGSNNASGGSGGYGTRP